MLSLLGQEFGSRSFLYRAAVAVVILTITLAVSAIWGQMVYTIPVLAVLLFLAAGLKGLSGGTTSRNLDEGTTDLDVDLDTGIDGG